MSQSVQLAPASQALTAHACLVCRRCLEGSSAEQEPRLIFASEGCCPVHGDLAQEQLISAALLNRYLLIVLREMKALTLGSRENLRLTFTAQGIVATRPPDIKETNDE